MAKVLFGVGSWGLGHATRSLPLIRGLIDAGQQVTVLGSGASLELLRSEVGNRCEILPFPGMRVPLGRTPFRFYLKYTLTLPLIWRDTVRQHLIVEQLVDRERFDLIVSDNRYAVWSRRAPSFLVAHGLRFIAPGRHRVLELGLERFNARAFRPFKEILVPDFADHDLSGDLSHRLLFYDVRKVRYLGLLASVERQECRKDLDMFISISGPEPQRSILEAAVVGQLNSIKVRGMVALGRPGAKQRWREGGWEVASYLNRAEQQQALNRCRLAVIRAGYTTLMELAQLGTPGVLIPTPGQTEQEYLVAYQAGLGHYGSSNQDAIDLSALAQAAPAMGAYEPPHLTDVSVQRFLQAVLS